MKVKVTNTGIRYKGRLYKKGESFDFLNKEEAEKLIKDKYLVEIVEAKEHKVVEEDQEEEIDFTLGDTKDSLENEDFGSSQVPHGELPKESKESEKDQEEEPEQLKPPKPTKKQKAKE